jgi:excisionase family DNA binding protein
MAGMFYTLIEVAERLSKTENQLRQMVQEGRLREFRDGPKLLFKKDEVDALSGQAGSMPDDTLGLEGGGDVESHGSTLGLSDEGVLEEERADKQDLEGDDLDFSLDSSGLDMALGGDDLDLDLAASRAAQELNLGDIDLAGDTDSAKNVIEKATAPAQEQYEELNLAPEEDHEDLGLKSSDSGRKSPVASDLEQGHIDEAELFSGKEPGQNDELGFEDDFGIEGVSENEGTKAESQGISVLGQDDTAYNLTGDSLGETAEVQLEGDKELGEEHSLDEDVSLESFGSGSGLLDLSLQADDTSLGAVLDDIIPGIGGGAAEQGGFDAGLDIGEEALVGGTDEVHVPAGSASAGFGESASIGQISAAAMAYIEPAPDASSNMFGVMLVIPFIVLVYTIIISIAGSLGISPNLLGSTQDIIWYIGGGLVFVAVIMMFIGAAAGGNKGGAAKAKSAKAAAPKKVNQAKPKMAKKK